MSNQWPNIIPSSVTYCHVPPVSEWENPLTEAIYKIPIPFLLFQNGTYPYNRTGVIVTDIHFCAPGYVYFGVIVTGIFLFLISGACLAYLFLRHRHENHLRKVLFALLTFIGLSRFVFCGIAYSRFSRFHNFRDIFSGMSFLIHSTIPLTASSDIVQSYIDFLLTFFWLDMLYPKFLATAIGRWLPIVMALATSVAGVVCIGLDYHDIVDEHQYDNGNLYYRTLSFTGILLLLSAVLHTAVVISLLRRMLRVGFRQLGMSPALRRQITMVAIICCASVFCMVGRAIVLLGRVTKVQSFVTGAMSFANPDFTASYFIGFLNMPPLAVAVAFFILTIEMAREAAIVEGTVQSGGGSYYAATSTRESMDSMNRSPLLGGPVNSVYSASSGGGVGEGKHRAASTTANAVNVVVRSNGASAGRRHNLASFSSSTPAAESSALQQAAADGQ